MTDSYFFNCKLARCKNYLIFVGFNKSVTCFSFQTVRHIFACTRESFKTTCHSNPVTWIFFNNIRNNIGYENSSLLLLKSSSFNNGRVNRFFSPERSQQIASFSFDEDKKKKHKRSLKYRRVAQLVNCKVYRSKIKFTLVHLIYPRNSLFRVHRDREISVRS